MPKVAAIILQQAPAQNTGCERALLQQSHPIFRTVLCPYAAEDNAATAVNQAMQQAFSQHGADYVWVLPADAEPAPNCLAQLLQCHAADIRAAIICAPQSTTLPYPIPMPDGTYLCHREKLPQSSSFACGGIWVGALYPRAVYNSIGQLNEALVTQGVGEEYAARAAVAGFSFCAVNGAAISAEAPRARVLRYMVGPYSYFYQCGLSRKERYYTMRNWAWIQRVQYPRHYLRRLIACGFYILFTLRAMLQANEVSIPRIYTIFRGLHNGFYGKLRPFRKNKNKKIS